VFDLQELDGLCFLVMELVEGESLANRLNRGEVLDESRIADIGQQIAAALSHLHRRGLIHRDIKPSNVLVRHDGATKLCDLGLARAVDPGQTVTRIGASVGTPAFMAPEQARGDHITTAADIFALGRTVSAMMNHGAKAPDDDPPRDIDAPPTAECDSTSPPVFSPWLSRLVKWMLEADPRDRPTAAQVEAAFSSRKTRLYPRRRHWIRGATALGLTCAAVSVWLATHHRPSVAFEVGTATVKGIDDRGGMVWERRLEGTVNQVERIDLDADGRDELVVVAGRDRATVVRPGSPMYEITVIRLDESLVTRAVPEDLIRAWDFDYPKQIVAHVTAADVDADGISELLVTCAQINYYPSSLLVYWPRWDTWDHVLNHTGRIYDVATGPGSRVAFYAVNNRLAMMPVVGVLRLQPPPDRDASASAPDVCTAPPLGVPDSCTSAVWDYYVPLEPEPFTNSSKAVSVTFRPEGSVDLDVDGQVIAIDQRGNPMPPHGGFVDLRGDRMWFMHQIWNLDFRAKPGWGGRVEPMVRELLERSPALLEEHAYLAIARVESAKALALTGDSARAITTLRTAVATVPFDGVRLLLANLYAIAGDDDRALDQVDLLMRNGTTVKSWFDAPYLRLTIQIERGDAAEVATWIGHFAQMVPVADQQAGVARALTAWSHVWSDRVEPIDVDVRSWSYAQSGLGWGGIARWRANRVRPRDEYALREAIAANPDAEGVSRLGLAAILLGLDQSSEALAEIDRARHALVGRAPIDFESSQLLDLATAMRAVALEASGDHESARQFAIEVCRSARQDRLPRILAAEVLGGCPD
jgi:tetratricopeptide (TPR) repeat protein